MAPLPSKVAGSSARPGRPPTAPPPGKAPEQPAGRSARPGRPPTAPPPGKAPRQVAARAPRLTERGAVLIMASCFFIGLLAATWLGWSVLAGLAFVVGCVLAAWYAAPPGLLTVVVSPPLLFLGAVIMVNALTGSGGLLFSVVLGSVVTLADVAPWLAAGMILTVIIALIRGLPRCIRDLYRELRSSRGTRGPGRNRRAGYFARLARSRRNS